MNVDKLRAMLELKAMQNFQSPSTNANTNPSLFQNMLNELINESTVTTDHTSNTRPLLQTNIHVNMIPTQLKEGPKSTTEFNNIIEEAARVYNIPSKLIHCVIKQESNYNPNARSHAGAGGLMQLMPGTAAELGVKDVYNARDNIFGGTKYLRKLMDQYNGDISLALAAYNAGPGNVNKFGGIPPFRETQQYVDKVTKSFYS